MLAESAFCCFWKHEISRSNLVKDLLVQIAVCPSGPLLGSCCCVAFSSEFLEFMRVDEKKIGQIPLKLSLASFSSNW